MKQFFLIILSLVLVTFVGCKNEETLEQKKAQLVKLMQQKEEVQSEIDALDKEIKELDPDAEKINKGKPVTVIEVKKGVFNHYFEVQGIAESQQNISLTTDIGGLIKMIYVSEGDKIKKGQTLVKLDAEIILNNIEELKTALDLANIIFEKQDLLWKQNIGSEIQYLQAKNNKESIEKKLMTARSQLDKTNIKSPINGTVDELFAKVGEMASPGRPVVRVVNLSDIKIEAEVPENYIGTVNVTDKVIVGFPAIGWKIDGVVKAVGQVVNPANRTFKLTVTIENKDSKIKPNLLATVKINDYTAADAIIVPTRLIQTSRDRNYMFTLGKDSLNNPIAEKKIIEKGMSYKGSTQIEKGLNAEDKLIDDGYRDVTNGDKLEIAQQ